MSFNKYDTVEDLNDSKHDWLLRVRAQAIWKGITKETKEFRGYNVIFVDDCNGRIHGFIAAALCVKYEGYLIEGQIYKLNDFSVKYYNGDETSRSVRTDKHIYFTNETKFMKDEDDGMKIEQQSFDLFCLEDVQNTKNDNRYLIDVVGVLDGTPTKIEYKKDGVEKSNVKFMLHDGRSYANVTFFNEFGDSFLKAMKENVEHPVIIIIASAKINEWNDEVSLTNYPATRFYINSSHHSVKEIRSRIADNSFYVTKLEDQDDKEIPAFTVKELFNLTEDYIEKIVQCKVIVKKFDKKVKWYTNFCAKCDIDIELIEKKYQCQECRKIYPYPDKRYQLTSLCSDNTGTVPIIWTDEEVIRLCGKTVYDIIADDEEVEDGDKFPTTLQEFEKKEYNITLIVTKENVKEGSKVYTATKIAAPNEMSGNHSPTQKKNTEVKATEISNLTMSSPPTGNSTTEKVRVRKRPDVIQCTLQETTVTNVGKLKCLKTESQSIHGKKKKQVVMSSNNYVHLRNVETGRTDWKIKIRIIREWRGVSLTGERFKGYNLLLLDAKNVRMVAYVPEWLTEKMQRLFTVGNMYTVTNFQVKQYTANDKWRCVNNDRQILFTNNTTAKQINESEYFIPNNHFDFFEMEELSNLAKQNVYLADAVGVVIKRDNLRPVRNTKLGTDQMQVRMKMTDGKKKINVIFWDKFAEDFQQDIDSNQYEEPLILIIASGKVGVWKEETDICNFFPTAYFINYKHHSVQQLRKLISEGNFSLDITYSTSQPRKPLRLCTVEEIKNFNQDYILIMKHGFILDAQPVTSKYNSLRDITYASDASDE
ncbi:hypothetical protein POM88_050788 [Heracleum sosnowskyi]|uniref:Replication protein A 70 kDa DNA-binding subunit B/D first OB fold domain-containing protein n=1 Tax=Heracleum sosnowskyi TaxID=360622 RepID=A0AAD8GYB0_9APIA|nr:hypothetical protein POM88_050788 [Heracleum sosnowskyi]